MFLFVFVFAGPGVVSTSLNIGEISLLVTGGIGVDSGSFSVGGESLLGVVCFTAAFKIMIKNNGF